MFQLILVISIVILDQLSKYFILKYLVPVGSIPVIPKFFYLTYVENRGAAFGLLQNQLYFFIIITIIVGSVLIYLIVKSPNKNSPVTIVLSMILGGAVGNFIDRVTRGYVVDFLDFRVWKYIFNIADAFLVVGSILLALFILFGKDQNELSK